MPTSTNGRASAWATCSMRTISLRGCATRWRRKKDFRPFLYLLVYQHGRIAYVFAKPAGKLHVLRINRVERHGLASEHAQFHVFLLQRVAQPRSEIVRIEQARRVSGIDYLALMLFDVLSGLDTVKICVAYELDGKRIETMPPTIPQFQRCKPVYIELPGWKEDISGIKSFGELPQAAQNYVRKIEELTKIKVAVLSVGPDRLQTVRLCDIF